MRRVVLYGIGWLAAATVAMLLAWQGVGRVGTNVTDRHAAPLTAEQARRQLERTIATGAGPGGAPAGGPASTSPGAGGGLSPTGTTAMTGPRATMTSPTAPGTPASGPRTTVTTGPGSGSSTTTAPSSGATETRTYNLVGGSTTLRFSPAGVTVVVANPNQGFSADVDHSGGGRVRVRFDSDSHRSQVEAWWDGGPRDEVREEGDD